MNGEYLPMKLNEWPGSIQKSVEKLVDKYFSRPFQPGAVLRRLPSDSALKWVDGIHQRKWFFLKARPYINVKFKNHAPQAVPVDLVSMLVVGSSYENKKRSPAPKPERLEFIVVEEPKPTKTSSNENWFWFKTKAGVFVRVRQLELARCLFLHNFHLARTAFRPNGLDGLAQISESNEATTIRFTTMADYPQSNLKSKAALAHLSWMLLDQNARKSFGSVLGFWMKSNGESWSFRFCPPRMKGWHIVGSGYYGKGDTSHVFTIDEVTRFHNPLFSYKKMIVIDHPRFNELLAEDPVNGKKPRIQRSDDDPLMDLSLEPLLGKRLDQIADDGFMFSFDDSLEVRVQVNGRRYRVKPSVDADSTPAPETSSPGHAAERGTGRELDHGINRGGEGAELISEDLTEVEPTYRFHIFEKVVEELGARPGFTFEKKACFQLPWPKDSNLAAIKTITGKPVQSYVALLTYQSVPVIVIEVDTESLLNSHTLSNLIVVFSKDATEGVKLVLQSCSTMGLYWDLDYIKRFNAAPKTCGHPHRVTKKDGKSVAVSPEKYQSRWVIILERSIKALVKEVKRA
jgi:hypothetical protein